MVLFTEKGILKKFNSVDEIITSFCIVRFEYYIKRKKHMLNQFDHEIKFLGNKKRFLEEIMTGDIRLFEENKDGKSRKSRKTSDIQLDLEQRGYDKEKIIRNDDEEDEDHEHYGGYDYLLRLQFKSITEEKINKLKNDISSKVKTRHNLAKTSEKQLWINDMDEFEKEYTKWLKIIDKELVKTKKTS